MTNHCVLNLTTTDNLSAAGPVYNDLLNYLDAEHPTYEVVIPFKPVSLGVFAKLSKGQRAEFSLILQ